ncbi:MAG TPA: hypothetical protein VJA94_08340 [Candidatus Angelobacter sp.]
MATKAKKALALNRDVIGIDVKFTLNTPDGLRRVTFELKKDTSGQVVKWTITFQLFERQKKTDPFGDAIVDLQIEVDTKLNNKAEQMADQGMTTRQSAFAIGPAADAAKDASQGDISQDKAKATVQTTLKK